MGEIVYASAAGVRLSPPEFNIQPLVHHYSDCVTHLINHEHNSMPQVPTITSRIPQNFTGRDRSYEKSFFGVRSFRCVLTVLFTYQVQSDYAFQSTFNFILPNFWSSPVQIYPQTVIFFAKSPHLQHVTIHMTDAIKYHHNLYFLPEIFILEYATPTGSSI